MVTCSYCNKELEREAFCNPAHKMAYQRKGLDVTQSNKPGEDVTKGNKPTPTVSATEASTPTFTFRKKACPKHKRFTCCPDK